MAADMPCAGGSSKKRHKKLRRIEPHTHDTIEGDSQAGMRQGNHAPLFLIQIATELHEQSIPP